MTLPEHSILVMGAGPAGLAFAYECKKLHIPCTVLESGTGPGDSWQRMPTNLKLLSPWYQNSLFQTPFLLPDLFRLVSARTFASYLTQQSKAHQLPVLARQPVKNVCKAGDSWIVDASNQFRAKILVNATGYYSSPFTPEFPGMRESRILRIHFADYKDADQTKTLIGGKAGRILIVGQRISAGQAAMELAKAGHYVTLSCRSPLQFSKPLWLQLLVSPLYFSYEDWIVKRRPFWKTESRPAMDGGESERWISQGRLNIKPLIKEIHHKTVSFIDKTEEPYDLIIFATGFKPALNHLLTLDLELNSDGVPRTHSFESTQHPNLYFVGLDGLRNFRSRYLRGIREDAALLASIIAKKLLQSDFYGVR